jgi:hypothetical protein
VFRIGVHHSAPDRKRGHGSVHGSSSVKEFGGSTSDRLPTACNDRWSRV